MKRNQRNAYNALKKLGVPLFERSDIEGTFLISGEDAESYKWCDYYDGYRIPDWEFGVHPLITKTLRKYNLFAEWENPACLVVWDV